MMKRVIDIIFSAVGLIVLAPLFLFVALAIKVDSRGPVFYRGTRAARGHRPFRIFKFRTMVSNADRLGGPSTPDDDPRITRLGAWLRRRKLDELPQLINVFLGHMSFVGPRPEVWIETLDYSPAERRVFEIRPGITDWASIRFRNEGEMLRGCPDPHRTYREIIRPEKMRLALAYVDDHSLLTDLRILLLTLKVTFSPSAVVNLPPRCAAEKQAS